MSQKGEISMYGLLEHWLRFEHNEVLKKIYKNNLERPFMFACLQQLYWSISTNKI